METELVKKHILVTGGASGIGKAIVQAFLDEGARVTATWYRNSPSGKLHGNLRWLHFDLGDPESIRELILNSEKTSGVLVNGVLPGLTLTKRVREKVPREVRDQVQKQTPTQKLSDPEDIASMAVYLGSAANRNITDP